MIQNVITQATHNFGEVIAVIKVNDNALSYKLMIKRDDPAIAERPYMTITWGEHGGFMFGHYDLTADAANEIIRE
jgi:hypothetical protein